MRRRHLTAMNMELGLPPSEEAEQQKESLGQKLKNLQDACRDCHPISPLECTTHCSIWKLRNEHRRLLKRMQDPNFTKNLLNALKNKRRLQVIEMVSRKGYSIEELQQELQRFGYSHSKQTIAQEYVEPLTQTGLADENQFRYRATILGRRIAELADDLRCLEEVLPPRSECHEEAVLSMLLREPKTYKELKAEIPARSVPRVLNRLQEGGLVTAAAENDYVYFFRTKRNSNNERLSTTAKRVHENIGTDGISARKLARKSMISLRRTYKYLRKLRGKKLIFSRKRPKSYTLTAKGLFSAKTLRRTHDLLIEVQETARLLLEDDGSAGSVTARTETNAPLVHRKSRLHVAPGVAIEAGHSASP